MRKTILMLINGFGIEKSNSAEIYNARLMPNLDAMTKECLFGTLTTPAGDYNNGYKLFSSPDKSKNGEDEIVNLIYDKKLGENVVLKSAAESITNENKMHVFYVVEDDQKWMHVKEFVKILNPNKDKKVFIHFIMTGTSTVTYNALIKLISKISFEINDYCKIGLVVGKNKINADDTLRAFYREQGEHWNESTKKFEILKKEVVNPEDAGVFMINGGFALKENDSVLFLNYDNVNMDRFYNDFTKIPVKLFSLYELNDQIPNMFKKPLNESASFASYLEKYKIKQLVLTTTDRINDLNYYLNGMKKEKSEYITYAVNELGLFSSKDAVINLVEGNNYDGIILDYSIGMFNKAADIRQTLSDIDSIIKNIRDASKEKDYTFIISSTYGMHAPIMDGVVQKVLDFSGKVPCIFQSNTFNKAEYSLNSGSVYALTMTYLTNICDDVKSNRLVHKLSNIEKMLSKK